MSRRNVSAIDVVGFFLPLREIAETRGVSLRTIQNQLLSIFAKLGLESRTELALLLG